ncbi:MAG: hypothetical protein LBH60_02330 [Prevotellaceae bacterium]|jgi:hypothetical protein|nr:hypothetical protein [Prevotellaceae bacterium]
MKKLFLNVVGILSLSICLLSCSKEEDNKVLTPITNAEIKKQWVISEKPVVNITLRVEQEGTKELLKQLNDTLSKCFREGDKYQFEDSGKCKVTRNKSTAPYPKTYEVKDKHLILDIPNGEIKFLTDFSGSKLTLKASTDEIRELVKPELEKRFEATLVPSILNFFGGEIQLVLTEEPAEDK